MTAEGYIAIFAGGWLAGLWTAFIFAYIRLRSPKRLRGR